MGFLKGILNFVRDAQIEAKNHRIEECGFDPYDPKVSSEFKTEPIPVPSVPVSICSASIGIPVADQHVYYPPEINVKNIICENTSTQRPDKVHKKWDEYAFEEYQLSECWPSSNPNDRPDNLFICKICSYNFLARIYGSMMMGFQPYEIVKHAMKAHYKAHTNCICCENLCEGYHVTGMSRNMLDKITGITVRQPDGKLVLLEPVEI